MWLCGHSLGGSLATLAAWRLERNAIPVHQVYTFGAPMIGNDTAAAGFEKQFAQRVFRYIDVDDVVPKLPTISLTSNTYGHCPQECKLGDGPGRDIPTELAPGGDIPPTGIAAVWGFVMSQVSSHLMSNYIKPRRRAAAEVRDCCRAQQRRSAERSADGDGESPVQTRTPTSAVPVRSTHDQRTKCQSAARRRTQRAQ